MATYQELLDEANCFACLGTATLAELLELSLLNRIATSVSGGSGGGGTPGGAPGDVQFNDAGAFGGFGDYNSGTGALTLPGTVSAPTFIGALTGAASLNVLKTGDTMTGPLTIVPSSANTIPLTVSGYSVTGASTASLFSLAGTLNTTGAPVVIDLNITDTASAATTKYFQIRNGAINIFNVNKLGMLEIANGLTTLSGNITFLGFDYLKWSGGSGIISIADGNLLIQNNAGTNFNMLQFGGVGVTFPAIKKSGIVLQARLTDDSAFSEFECSNIITNNATAAFSTNTTLTDFAAAALGTLSNAPTAGNPAKWIAIDDNGTQRLIPTWI